MTKTHAFEHVDKETRLKIEREWEVIEWNDTRGHAKARLKSLGEHAGILKVGREILETYKEGDTLVRDGAKIIGIKYNHV